MGELFEGACALARGAGSILRRAYAGGKSSVSSKSTLIDLVTAADREAEAYLLGEIERRYPDHEVLAEESGARGAGGPFRWIVDPLDGTVNFAHGIPHFAVLLAVQERKAGGHETVAAVTYDPLRDELFAAATSEGATLNGERLRVSSAARLIDAVAATGFMYNRLFKTDDNHREFCRINLLTQGVRRNGAAGLDLAYVAAGRFDLFWEYDLKPWDLAGGALLVHEAGGVVTAPDGSAFDLSLGNVAASNGTLHAALLEALRSAREHPAASREGLAELLPGELADKVAR